MLQLLEFNIHSQHSYVKIPVNMFIIIATLSWDASKILQVLAKLPDEGHRAWEGDKDGSSMGGSQAHKQG